MGSNVDEDQECLIQDMIREVTERPDSFKDYEAFEDDGSQYLNDTSDGDDGHQEDADLDVGAEHVLIDIFPGILFEASKKEMRLEEKDGGIYNHHLSKLRRGSLQEIGHEEDGYCFPDIQEKHEQRHIKKGLTLDFEKNFKKQHHFWDEFVQYKLTEESEVRTRQNKENASLKKHFHHLGQGGYSSAILKWQKMEEDLMSRAIVP
ncbi:hypothetical protein C2845_PM11G18370 [Panicum miliaceum]|uniref:Uncharacterized protein n=1 Tax=Panicum miliaceum TaxID=4540 RepID=A0A3L6RUN0_PANMI|nr:hypothetical protein C2845_PM11G18370 [Panicum miliaceum]